MVSYKRKANKTHKRRRSKKGGDDTWDIEKGPVHERPEQLSATKSADDMESGRNSPTQQSIYELELQNTMKKVNTQ
jgi:hypothetical protein